MPVAKMNLRSTQLKGKYSIEVVAKAFDILQIFIDAKKEALSLTELTASAKLNKNAVFRLLFTMIEKGVLKKAPDSVKYMLSSKCIELGRAARLVNNLRKLAIPYMQELWREFDDTINLALLENGEICYLEVLESPHRFKLVAAPGDRDPVHSTALGKAMMAHLSDEEVKRILKVRGMPRMTSTTIITYSRFEEELRKVRERGYAINEGEMVEGSRCVAVPILSAKGQPAAALSVSGTSMRITDSRIPQISQKLLQCCREISKQVD
jgi:IclR family transcriptional regulator, KDG regulon repressor